jgi:hypothetical protein
LGREEDGKHSKNCEAADMEHFSVKGPNHRMESTPKYDHREPISSTAASLNDKEDEKLVSDGQISVVTEYLASVPNAFNIMVLRDNG